MPELAALAPADLRPLLESWLAEEQAPPLRAPWFRPGWYCCSSCGAPGRK